MPLKSVVHYLQPVDDWLPIDKQVGIAGVINGLAMKVLFLDQSGQLGGAELSLTDVAKHFKHQGLVYLFEGGPFADKLAAAQVPYKVRQRPSLSISKESGLWQGLLSLRQLLPLVGEVAKMAQTYDLIYANTQKALVVGAMASVLARKPLVYHLRDILSAEHFSPINRRVAITLANTCATLVIANSQATRQAFMDAGGRPQLIKVVYNGFDPDQYEGQPLLRPVLQQQHAIQEGFWIGHFSRLSPWKGQHVLVDALQYLDEAVQVLLVGKALFGEDDYVQSLQAKILNFGLQDHVHFLGFRSDIPALMASCDLVAHTSTSPEPFGRVIIESMLSGCPVVAAKDGGATELIDHGKTGWLCPPNDPQQLAQMIGECQRQPQLRQKIATQARVQASQTFSLEQTNQVIAGLLQQHVRRTTSS